MIPDLFGPTYNAIWPMLEAAIAAALDAITGWVAGWIWIGLTVAVAFKGAHMVYGRGSVHDMAVFAARSLVVGIIASSVGSYNEWVRLPILGAADELLRLVASLAGNGNLATSTAEPFDWLLKDALLIAMRVWQSLGLTDFLPALGVALFLLAAAVATGFAFVLWFATVLVLQMLLALGPIFVALAMFDFSRNKFYRFLDAAFYRLVLMTTAVLFIQVVLTAEGLLLETLARPEGTAIEKVIGLFLGIALFAVATWIVVVELPRLASDLAGGGGTGLASSAAAVTFGAVGYAAGRMGAGAARATNMDSAARHHRRFHSKPRT